jgi:hypothetical protein
VGFAIGRVSCHRGGRIKPGDPLDNSRAHHRSVH